jgi:hypothetical protein
MKIFFHESYPVPLAVDRVVSIRFPSLFNVSRSGYANCAQVGGIYLRVPAETPEILVDYRGIEESKKAGGQISVQPLPVRVKIVK